MLFFLHDRIGVVAPTVPAGAVSWSLLSVMPCSFIVHSVDSDRGPFIVKTDWNWELSRFAFPGCNQFVIVFEWGTATLVLLRIFQNRKKNYYHRRNLPQALIDLNFFYLDRICWSPDFFNLRYRWSCFLISLS